MAILFSDLCLLFERIAAIKPTRAGQHDATAASKTLIVFKQWLSALTDASTRDGIVLFRLIFPDHDIRRRYGLKETLLARELRKALSFSSNALACWRDGNSEASVVYEDIDSVKRKAGCFGHHLEAVLAPRRDFTMENAPSIDIQRLDALLDELASHCEYSCNEVRQLAYDRQKHRFRSCILFDLFSPLSAKESAYLAQIILRDLTPLLYPLPTCIAEAALSKFNSSSYQELSLTEALREWHWLLPIVYRYRADIGQAFAVVDSQKIDRKRAYTQAERLEIMRTIALPTVGTRIEIPKAVKGRGCRSVAFSCESAGKVYLETKYDGERMQIHVDLSAGSEQVITIFSKSKRDSTADRIRTHPLILAALGLPFRLSPHSAPTHLLLQRLEEAGHPTASAPVSSVVLEAEMVAYNEVNEIIDEFAYIPTCAQGIPPLGTDKDVSPCLLDSSQTTSLSASQTSERHLAIVFFDILLLNGQSLVFDTYERRRSVLENTVRPIEGHVMLADRAAIDFAGAGSKAGYESLVRAFAKCIVDRQEGLMIKPASSIYNDTRPGQHWIKLKRDYIPGLGDTASFCIVGASWTKERGRELRVPSTCFTTFYVGVLTNGWELENGTAQKPNYLVLFSVSHLASREMLLEANNRIQQRGGVDKAAWFSRLRKSWSFDMELSNSCSEMSFVLTSPLVFELYGAGFTRSHGSKYYELRFPRVSAIHHSRQPSEGVSLEELQAMGRDASSWIDSEAEDEIDDMWTRCSSGTEGEEAAPRQMRASWRAKQEKMWIEKLEKADRPKQKKRKKSVSSPQILKTVRRARTADCRGLVVAHAALEEACQQPAMVAAVHESGYQISRLSLEPPAQVLPHGAPKLATVNYLWTVFPRQAIQTQCLTYEGRISSLPALLEQAGWEHVDGSIHERQARKDAVIFTSPGQEEQLAKELRTAWRQGAETTRVAICSVDALSILSGSLETLDQLKHHASYL